MSAANEGDRASASEPGADGEASASERRGRSPRANLVSAAIRQHLGIRFAEPPLGPWRWRPPVYTPDEKPLGYWAPDCPQTADPARTRAVAQDEDCLFLNIWAPEDAEGLPVLVWFYGGSFLFGSASDPTTDGARLAGLGCVVVSAAYRVGLLGYLAHPALSAESGFGSSGNYGLLDNICALAWVRDHIEDYGGDPERVTAFGVSAGSASLALLQTSPLAEGHFDQLILQSPGAFRPLASLADAEAAGLTAYGSDLAAMRKWPADEALRQSAALVPKVRGLTSPRMMRPIRDGWVIPENDRDAYRAGRFHAVPTIVGGNLHEGVKLTAAWPVDSEAAYRDLIAANFGRPPRRGVDPLSARRRAPSGCRRVRRHPVQLRRPGHRCGGVRPPGQDLALPVQPVAGRPWRRGGRSVRLLEPDG